MTICVCILQDSASSEDQSLDAADDTNPAQQVQHLERSINFLRQQHHEVLASLHDEIERLKIENKGEYLVCCKDGRMYQENLIKILPSQHIKLKSHGDYAWPFISSKEKNLLNKVIL